MIAAKSGLIGLTRALAEEGLGRIRVNAVVPGLIDTERRPGQSNPHLGERDRSRTHIDFTRFSIVNQLAPCEDIGVFLNGMTTSGRWEYGLAAYNGTGDADLTSSADVAARLMMHPFVGDGDSVWQNLQVGVAATHGHQNRSVGIFQFHPF